MKSRSAYIDNAKLILIFLVVLGHIIQFSSPKDQLVKAVFIFIYLFHMPAFVLLSGFLAKNLKKTPKRLIKFALLYISFELLYYLIIGNMRDFLISPYVHLWFLISLFWWNLMLPLFAKMKVWIALPLALILSLFIGCLDFIGLPLSLSRTFYFFPFFLAGYFIPASFKRETGIRLRLAAALILCAVFICVLFMQDFNTDWVLGKSGYAALKLTNMTGILLRLSMYAVSCICAVCFFILVPKKKTGLTRLGGITLTIYTLHYFPIYYIAMYRLIYMTSPPLTYLAILAAAVIITLIPGIIPVQRFYKKIRSVYMPLEK